MGIPIRLVSDPSGWDALFVSTSYLHVTSLRDAKFEVPLIDLVFLFL